MGGSEGTRPAPHNRDGDGPAAPSRITDRDASRHDQATSPITGSAQSESRPRRGAARASLSMSQGPHHRAPRGEQPADRGPQEPGTETVALRVQVEEVARQTPDGMAVGPDEPPADVHDANPLPVVQPGDQGVDAGDLVANR